MGQHKDIWFDWIEAEIEAAADRAEKDGEDFDEDAYREKLAAHISRNRSREEISAQIESSLSN